MRTLIRSRTPNKEKNTFLKPLREFDIQLQSLKPGKHIFEHTINDRFFGMFKNSLVGGASLKATVQLNKTSLLLTLRFEIVGTITLTCDRTLRQFDRPLQIDHNIYFKNGEREEEVSEDVYHITPKTDCINTAQFIYELVTLAVPMKKLHPDVEATEAPTSYANPLGDVVYSTQTDPETAERANASSPDDSTETDPRWEALRQLRNRK